MRELGRLGGPAVPLMAAVCALVLGLAGCGGSSPVAAATAAPRAPGTDYTLMQMNLCLSGLAGCYGRVQYPAGVEAAVARIREVRPDAVTLNEACSGDVARIARQTGYDSRFARVIYYGKPLPCVDPGDRGLFGDAVLTKARDRAHRQPSVRGTSRSRAPRMAVRRDPRRRRGLHRAPGLQ